MRYRSLKLGLVGAMALSAMIPILAAQPAYADYAPSSGDVVGVGSDTLQYMLDFLADGDGSGTTGYNQLGNKNKLVNFDATADANARLAYGSAGGSATAACSPGTGSTAGTGNASSGAGDPCVLNPTIVLRAGLQPVQRPNGSGGGFNALVQDVLNGTHNINYSRSSAPQSPATVIGNCGSTSPTTVPCLDSITIGTDTEPILTATTTNYVALSNAELKAIYAQTTTGSDPFTGGPVQTGCITWNELPGNSGGSADTIVPIIPQLGSGTRQVFLDTIQGLAITSKSFTQPPTTNGCTVTGEENDPTAIIQQGANAKDAIEPMSTGRLNLFLGQNSTGVSDGLPSVGYFTDPSCGYDADSSACDTLTSATTLTTALSTSGGAITTLSVAATTATIATNTLLVVTDNAGHSQVFKTNGSTPSGSTSITVDSATPNFAYPIGASVDTKPVPKDISATSVELQPMAGTAGDGTAVYTLTRSLYVYFRNSDITSTTPYQPGGTANWLNTLLYDPCDTGESGCQTIGSVTYGPAGQPYIDVNSTPITDAGVTPVDPDATGNFQTGGA